MASPLPGENCFTDEDVARICRETPYVPNPGTQMLPRGTDMCRCPTCGLYFNSSFAFTKHRIGRVGTPERRCLTQVEMLNAGFAQGPKGHWLSSRKTAESLVRHCANSMPEFPASPEDSGRTTEGGA